VIYGFLVRGGVCLVSPIRFGGVKTPSQLCKNKYKTLWIQ